MWSQHVRLLRAAVVSVVILALSAGAHVVGGGELPDPAIVLGLGALMMLAVTAGARHALTFPALMGVLGCGQFVLHHAFGLLSTAATCVPASTHLHFGLGGHATLACSGPLEMQQSGAAGGADAAMLAAHLVATLATAVVITRGEESLHATSIRLAPSASDPAAARSPASTGTDHRVRA